jgi:hypothetical protein
MKMWRPQQQHREFFIEGRISRCLNGMPASKLINVKR